MKENVLFVTGCYPKDNDYFVVHSKVMPQNAANVLSWRLIEGFDANIPGKMTVLTCPFIGYYPHMFTKLWIHSRRWAHDGVHEKDTLLGFLNIKGLETYIKSVRIYRFAKKWYRQSEGNRNLLFYSHYAGFLRAAGKLKKKLPDLSLTCLVTDLNELYAPPGRQGLMGKIKGLPRKIMVDVTYKNLPSIDSFVLLAEDMKEYLKVGGRPYVVVEGIADPALLGQKPEAREPSCVPEKEKGEFRIVYTGTLHKRYNLLMLAQAVILLEDSNVKLYLCGDGDCRKELEEMAGKCPSIRYLGVIKREDAVQLQQSADLLVNSRPDLGLRTKLSFPSKTMEYMMSGKPVVCFKLGGIPKEYDGYLRYFPEETPQAMAQIIREIQQMPPAQREQMGKRSQAFMCDKKNPKVQVESILRMMFR